MAKTRIMFSLLEKVVCPIFAADGFLPIFMTGIPHAEF